MSHIDDTRPGTNHAHSPEIVARAAAPPDDAVEEATVRLALLTAAGVHFPRVASDAPASELVAELVRHYRLDDHERWALADPVGQLLDGEQTLQSAGIRDGDELALIPERVALHKPADPPPSSWHEPAAARHVGGGVSERTAALLPAQPSPGSRVRALWRALLPAGTETTAVVPGAHVNPASLAQAPRPPLMRRVRQAGRQGGYEHRLERVITAPLLSRCAVVAVISGKGGVGKTTVASLLGSLFAFLRADRVIAVDTNPDFGMLGAMLSPGQGLCIDELLAGPLAQDDQLASTELDAALARGPDGLLVCPGPVEPERCEQLSTADYLRCFERLRSHAGILVLDCGTSFTSKPAKAVLEVADQLVLLADDTMQAAAVAIYAGRWLAPQRYPVTLALNKRDGKGYINLAKLEEGVPDARALATIPSDEAAVAQLSAGFSWRDDQGALGRSIRELAALLAGDWPRLHLAATPEEAP